MNLELEHIDTNIFVKHYDKNQIQLNQAKFSNNIIFSQDEIINNEWSVNKLADITDTQIAELLDQPTEVILLGTGEKTQIPPQKLLIACARARKSIDFMSSDAACRTFNILAQEGRRVVAAILLKE